MLCLSRKSIRRPFCVLRQEQRGLLCR
jgi:hypothetical protein